MVVSIEEYSRLTEQLPSFKPAPEPNVRTWLSTLLRSFADRLVPVTSDVCEEWGAAQRP